MSRNGLKWHNWTASLLHPNWWKPDLQNLSILKSHSWRGHSFLACLLANNNRTNRNKALGKSKSANMHLLHLPTRRFYPWTFTSFTWDHLEKGIILLHSVKKLDWIWSVLCDVPSGSERAASQALASRLSFLMQSQPKEQFMFVSIHL